MNLEHLNEQQKEAVVASEPALLVLAGAGSGKTRVLTTRIAYLIHERNVAPWQILAFTFTNKAAGEMKTRIEAELGSDAEGMWIGTFHSICARMLRRDIDRLGYARDFTIYDTQDQRTLLKQIMKESHVAPDLKPQAVLSVISSFKNEGVLPEQALKNAASEKEKWIAALYQRYEKAKKRNSALDFDDLILKGIELLKIDSVREAMHRQFRYLFVDEYQDTNHPQYDLIRLLAGHETHICVVGDADQSIYGWRGADIQNILRFEQDFPGARTILLEQNYRSTGKILDAANCLIQNNTERKKKNLWTANGTGEAVRLTRVQSEHEEAVLVASEIQRERSQGTALSDMAVLYRTNAQSRPFEDVFLREGITYRVVGGLKFYDRAEIKDLIAYMNLVVNPLDDVAFRRVVNVPKRGIGDASIEALREASAQAGMSLFQGLLDDDVMGTLSNAPRNKFLTFRDIMQRLNAAKEAVSLTDFVQEVYEATGYHKMLEHGGTVEDQSRMENVEAFFNAVATYEEEDEDPSLVHYLENLALLSDLDKTEEKENGVNLMTVHSAKGLEFPVVFVVGLEEGLFPSKRTIDEGNVEEERRLLYVAMTRAEQRLYLSQAESHRVFGQQMMASPSRFLDEISSVVEEDDSPSVRDRTNVYDRNYAARGSFANPKLRAEYDRQRAQFRHLVRERQEQKRAAAAEGFRVGDKIRHKKFGEGTVISVVSQPTGDELTVAFDAKGIKRLNVQLAPIQKI